MLRFHAIQAKNGDCLVLEYGKTDNPKFMLIDGGPAQVYPNFLKPFLENLSSHGGKLETILTSHVDDDHIHGLLDLLAEIEKQKSNQENPVIEIENLWHNTFEGTLGAGTDIAVKMNEVMSAASQSNNVLVNTDMAINSINQGNKLRRYAKLLKIPINSNFDHGTITVDEYPDSINMENLRLQIVGPTQENLEKLKEEWLEWLEENEDKLAGEDAQLAAYADKSAPNLSSIMILVTNQDNNKTLLLTGDGRGDFLIEGLKMQNLLDENGTFHVDCLKVMHHGSDRNVTPEFFEKLKADNYVISGDGKHGNPEPTTLSWIVKAAHKDKRKIKIYVTNETDGTKDLRRKYPKEEYGYDLIIRNEDKDFLSLEL